MLCVWYLLLLMVVWTWSLKRVNTLSFSDEVVRCTRREARLMHSDCISRDTIFDNRRLVECLVWSPVWGTIGSLSLVHRRSWECKSFFCRPILFFELSVRAFKSSSHRSQEIREKCLQTYFYSSCTFLCDRIASYEVFMIKRRLRVCVWLSKLAQGTYRSLCMLSLHLSSGIVARYSYKWWFCIHRLFPNSPQVDFNVFGYLRDERISFSHQLHAMLSTAM